MVWALDLQAAGITFWRDVQVFPSGRRLWADPGHTGEISVDILGISQNRDVLEIQLSNR